jgi:hypothetical protein
MSVRGCLADAVRHLTRRGGDEVLRALRLLGRADLSPVTVAGLAALLGRSAGIAEEYAEHLVDSGLAEALPDGRYLFLELVRAYARELDHDTGDTGNDVTEPDRVNRHPVTPRRLPLSQSSTLDRRCP